MNESVQPIESGETRSPRPVERDLDWVFFGPGGLRAVWGLLLFATIFIGVEIALNWTFYPVLQRFSPAHGTPVNASFQFLSELLSAIAVMIATIALSFIERRPVLSYGYLGPAKALRFVFGFFSGFLAISIVVLTLWKAGLLSFEAQRLHGADIWTNAAGWACVFLTVAFLEESTLRGYVQYTLTRGLGFWWSALLFSFLFGFGHNTNPGETPVGLFSAGAMGLVFCLSLWYTGSLWWAVGFHAAWDWGESYFYGTSDSGMITRGHLLTEHPVGNALWSGGATGPEGSLIVLPFLALFALLMWLWWGKRGQTPWRGYAWKPAPAPASSAAAPPLSIK